MTNEQYGLFLISKSLFSQIFGKDGQFKYAFGHPGKEEGKLWYPRKIAVLQDTGNFVICDRGNERSRMQIFSPMGHFIRRIQIRFIDIVAGLAIDKRNRIVAVDSVTPTIFVLDEAGNLLNYIGKTITKEKKGLASDFLRFFFLFRRMCRLHERTFWHRDFRRSLLHLRFQRP